MKKFRAVSLLVTVLLMTSMSFSLLKVEGTYSVFAKQAGLGFGVSLPLIPMVDTTLYAHFLGEANISGTAAFDVFSFAGTTKVNSTAIELQAKLPVSIMEFNVGGTLLLDIMNGNEPNSGKDFFFVSGIYAGIFGNYQKPLFPLVDMFGQVGFLFKVVDGAKLVNDQVSGGAGTIDFGNINRSGLYFRAGLSVGL